MNNNFVDRKDSIIASAIEIISESGMDSLTTKTLADEGKYVGGCALPVFW